MEKINLKKRRGLHTIVGAVFFVLVMGSTIGYVTYSMGLVDNLAYQLDAKQDANLNRESEKFEITEVRIDNNEFNLTVRNTGTLPINVTKIWAKNMTDLTWNQTDYQINQLVSPGATLSDIGQGTNLFAKDSESYSLKLLTTRGNALETQVYSTANLPLEMTLVSNPVNPVGGEDVNVVFTVKNNLTNGAIIQSVVPQMDFDDGTSTVTQIGTVTPASYQGLIPGETATFEYTFDVAGDEDETAIFNATIANAVQGNFVTDTSTIIVVPQSYEALESELSKSFGKLFLNYTTFEACEPSKDDCTSDSTDWQPGWDLKKGRDYIYRIQVRNTNDYSFLLEDKTSIMMIQARDTGIWDGGKIFYILGENTPSNEGPINYSQYSEKVPGNDSTHTVYFGAASTGPPTLATLYDQNGNLALFMLFFACEDLNDDGNCNNGEPHYSQNLPFQAISTFS